MFPGADVGEGLKLRLSVCDQTGRSVHVYLDLSHAPYPPGLLPGNTLLLSAFQRRLSRSFKHTHLFIYRQTDTHTDIYLYIDRHTHTHTDIYLYIYTHTHITNRYCYKYR